MIPAEDHSATWTSKRFMSCGCDDIKAAVKGVGMSPPGNQAGHMGHVGHGDCAYFVRDVLYFGEIRNPRIGGISNENNFGMFFFCGFVHEVVVQFTCFDIFHFVSDEFEYFGHVGDRMSMREMAPVA